MGLKPLNKHQLKYFAFLKHLRKLTSDGAISINITTELKQYGMTFTALAVLMEERVLAVKNVCGINLYEWNTIEPNIFMVDALIEAEAKRKEVLNDKEYKTIVPELNCIKQKVVENRQTKNSLETKNVITFERWLQKTFPEKKSFGWFMRTILKLVYKQTTKTKS